MTHRLSIPRDIQPREFYANLLPEILRWVQAHGLPRDIAFRYMADLCDPDSRWGVILDQGVFTVVEGAVDRPDLVVAQSTQHWRDSLRRLDGIALDRSRLVRTLSDRAKLKVLLETRGTLSLQLLGEGRAVIHSTDLRFHDADQPHAVISMKFDDYRRLSQGRLNPLLAVATRKIRFSGDLGFLMRLAPLRA